MSVAATIEVKLKDALNPKQIKIVDQSHLHRGHSGSTGDGETHFAVEIVADRFQGMSRLERQRLVNEILAEELAGPVHALSIRAIVREEM